MSMLHFELQPCENKCRCTKKKQQISFEKENLQNIRVKKSCKKRVLDSSSAISLFDTFRPTQDFVTLFIRQTLVITKTSGYFIRAFLTNLPTARACFFARSE